MEGELQFNKLGYDAFYGTCLEYCLRTQGIKTLVIVGILTDMCIASTVSTAFHYEYGVVVPSDCTRAFTPERTDAYLICFDEAYGAVRRPMKSSSFWRGPTSNVPVKERGYR